MGVIKPSWISEDWFARCPFNFCDHFGDKDTLAQVCIICRDTRREDYPYNLANITVDAALQELVKAILSDRRSLSSEKKLDSTENKYIPDLPPFHSAHSIYTLVEGYSQAVIETEKNLKEELGLD